MLGTWLAAYAARAMAQIEDLVFFLADGTATYDSIVGIVPAAIAAGRVHQTSGASPAEITLTDMRSLRAKVASAAISRGAYYLHRTHEQKLCTFNTGGNTFYIINGATGEATLDGFPVRWVEVMPVYTASDSASTGQVVFGDLRYQWLGSRSGIHFQASKEAAFATDEVLIRALERFDVGLMADDALAVIQLAAS
jgi:HK97 family phage major capsid protein